MIIRLLLLATLICAFMVLLTGQEYSYQDCSLSDNNEKIISAVPKEGSILFYPYTMVRKTLLALDPTIYRIHYSIDFSLPLKLKIGIDKRTPEIVLKSKSQWYGLDKTGVLFPMAARLPGYPLIELSGQPSPQEIRQVLRIIKNPTLPKFKGVAIDQNGGLTFYSKEGIVIRVPGLAGIDERFKVLSPLLQVVREKKIRSAYIDLSSEEMPVFRVLSKR